MIDHSHTQSLQRRARRVRIATYSTASALVLGMLLFVAYFGLVRSTRGAAVLQRPPEAMGQYTFELADGLEVMIASLPGADDAAGALLRERHARLKGLFHGSGQLVLFPPRDGMPEQWVLHVPFLWSGESLRPNLEELLRSSGALLPRGEAPPPGAEPALGWYEVRSHGLIVTSSPDLEVPPAVALGPIAARELRRRCTAFRWEGTGLPARLAERLRKDQRERIPAVPLVLQWKDALGADPEAMLTIGDGPAVPLRPLWPVIGAPREAIAAAGAGS
jgi:hypothetical protein